MTILSAAIFSCGNKNSNAGETNSTVNSGINQMPAGENANTSEAETTSAQIMPALPDKTYGGYEFTFLLKGPNYNEWASMDIASEGENGDIINDSI